jgi:hypothetical protein
LIEKSVSVAECGSSLLIDVEQRSSLGPATTTNECRRKRTAHPYIDWRLEENPMGATASAQPRLRPEDAAMQPPATRSDDAIHRLSVTPRPVPWAMVGA